MRLRNVPKMCIAFLAGVSLATLSSQAKQDPDRAYKIAVTVPGKKPVTLYAEEWGAGAPLLLLHGLAASTFTWRHVAPDLAADRRVIALDLKGFGRSEKPLDRSYSATDQADLVTAFIQKRGLEDVTLIGHSFGGTVALLAAHNSKNRDPGRVARLVVIDAPAVRQNFPHLADLSQVPVLPHVLAALPAPELLARTLIRIVSLPGRSIPQEDVRGYAAPFYELAARHAAVVTAQHIVSNEMRRFEPLYRSLEIPVLLLWCRKDDIVPLSVARRLKRRLTNARLDVLEGCNHLPQDEVPAAFVRQVREFLNK